MGNLKIAKMQIPLTFTRSKSNRNFRILNSSSILIKFLSFYSPDDIDIYKEVECTYVISLLKKKASSQLNDSKLFEIRDKAKRTLVVLTRNMVTGDVTLKKIFKMYGVFDEKVEEKHKRKNCIMLLLRCKKMYEARFDVRRLLYLFV